MQADVVIQSLAASMAQRTADLEVRLAIARAENEGLRKRVAELERADRDGDDGKPADG